MKREILFKAKRVDNGEWVEGDLLNNYWLEYNKSYKTAIRYEINGCYSYPIEVHPETVCQFTGLLDKNGNKIFEGDQVKAGSPNLAGYVTGYVIYNSEFCRFEVDVKPLSNWDFYYIDEIEIRGNIHDK